MDFSIRLEFLEKQPVGLAFQTRTLDPRSRNLKEKISKKTNKGEHKLGTLTGEGIEAWSSKPVDQIDEATVILGKVGTG